MIFKKNNDDHHGSPNSVIFSYTSIVGIDIKDVSIILLFISSIINRRIIPAYRNILK